MSLDLSTAAGVLRFAELRRGEMLRCFERLGRFESNGYSFCFYVFATHAVELSISGEQVRTVGKLPEVEPRKLELPQVARLMVPPERYSAVMGEIVRRYVKATRAVGVLTMSEMWVARTSATIGADIDEERRKLPERLEHAPGRGEALRMFLEHTATGHRHWTAEIYRDPTRLAPWIESDGVPARGRLTGLMEAAD